MKVLGLIYFASLLAPATAFPSGAASCLAGTSAILSPNLPHATNAQADGAGESLASYGLEVMLDGELLDPETPTDFSVGEPHELSIMATGDAFRGFLMRLESTDGVDTTSALAPTTGDIFVRVAEETCIAVNQVGGITHSNPNRVDVTGVTGVLEMNEPSSGMVLDITVVIRNSVMDNISNWRFSTFTLNAVSTPAPTTSAPIPSPTTMPPTNEPSGQPSIAPLPPPTSFPTKLTQTPSSTPSSRPPTGVPTNPLSNSPSSRPSLGETSVAPAASPPTPLTQPSPTPVPPVPSGAWSFTRGATSGAFVAILSYVAVYMM